MGVEHSMLSHRESMNHQQQQQQQQQQQLHFGDNNNSTSTNHSNNNVTIPTKPNKIKKFNHFHSKPSHIIDLIVNKDWQKLLATTSAHQKEIFVSHKVRLFGVDRKVLPLHLACAMSPPVEVIDALLKVDMSLTTVKTPMKNYKKRTSSKNHHHNSVSFPHVNRSYHKKNSNRHSIDTNKDDTLMWEASDLYPSLSTPKTEPISSFDDNDDEDSTNNPSSSFSNHDNEVNHSMNSFFFATTATTTSTTDVTNSSSINKITTENQHRSDYALQITPSGDVRQISPNGKYSKSVYDYTESPFVHVNSHGHENSGAQRSNSNNRSCIDDEFLPLHIACLFKASPAVIERLIKAYPVALEIKNKWGMLPIHIVCSTITLESPKIASQKAVDDMTARRYLNNLVADTITDRIDIWEMEGVVQVLVDSFPQSLDIPSDNADWLTPIEYIDRNFPNGPQREHLLTFLKEKRQSIVMNANARTISSESLGLNDGCEIRLIKAATQRTLLYSYLKRKDWDNAQLQVKQYPKEASCWVLDHDYDSGTPHLPIHLACLNLAPTEIIHLLIEAYPDGSTAKGKHGFNPLHLACKKSLPDDVILELIQQCPSAVSQKDEYGRMPLHLACKSNLSIFVMKTLIDAYPESITMKDYNGHTALTYYYTQCDSGHDEMILLFERIDVIHHGPDKISN